MHINKVALFWLALLLLFIWFLNAEEPILLPFVVGILVAYFLDPLADKCEEWGMSRHWAAICITSIFFLILIIVCMILGPLLYQQSVELVKKLPDYVEAVRTQLQPLLQEWKGVLNYSQLESVRSSLGDVSGKAVGVLGGILGGVLKSGAAFLNLLSLLLITPIVSFYLLRDWDRLVERIEGLLPREHADTIRSLVEQMDAKVAQFIRGQMMVAAILGVFYAIALTIIGLDFGVLIGLLGGLLIIIPYLGTIVAGILAVGMAYLQFDTIDPVLIVLGVYVFGQVVEGNFLTPKIVGDKVGLHPAWIIFGLLAGGTLLGFVGVLIAVPVTAMIGVLVRFAIERYQHSSLYKEHSDKSSAADAE